MFMVLGMMSLFLPVIPLARHDGSESASAQRVRVSTHMPLARHDHFSIFPPYLVLLFLLTCLLRGMTGAGWISLKYTKSFYSHASCEA